MKVLYIICCLGFMCLVGFSGGSILESSRWGDWRGIGLGLLLCSLSLYAAFLCGSTARSICRDEQAEARRRNWKRFPTPRDDDFS